MVGLNQIKTAKITRHATSLRHPTRHPLSRGLSSAGRGMQPDATPSRSCACGRARNTTRAIIIYTSLTRVWVGCRVSRLSRVFIFKKNQKVTRYLLATAKEYRRRVGCFGVASNQFARKLTTGCPEFVAVIPANRQQNPIYASRTVRQKTAMATNSAASTRDCRILDPIHRGFWQACRITGASGGWHGHPARGIPNLQDDLGRQAQAG